MTEYTDTYNRSVISETIRDAEVDNTTGRTSHYIIFPNSVGSFYIPSN